MCVHNPPCTFAISWHPSSGSVQKYADHSLILLEKYLECLKLHHLRYCSSIPCNSFTFYYYYLLFAYTDTLISEGCRLPVMDQFHLLLGRLRWDPYNLIRVIPAEGLLLYYFLTILLPLFLFLSLFVYSTVYLLVSPDRFLDTFLYPSPFIPMLLFSFFS